MYIALNLKQIFKSILNRRCFYDSRTKHDTIFAPVTAVSATRKGAPLGVIRLSGTKTEEALQQMTHYKVVRDANNNSHGTSQVIRPRQATLVKILEPNRRETIDKGLVLWFPKPRSYTGEDVCELHLHGSKAIMKNMLDTLGSLSGMRPAEPGEFTRRAVMNGKMSLLEAESLSDLIASNTDQQRKLALSGLDGSTLIKYNNWIAQLIGILAHLEASIDFGEDELIGEQKVVGECIEKIGNLTREIESFIQAGSRRRDMIQAGFRMIILGRPNAGKSTFMNLLCGQNKSIVSNLEGTTRDVVEHSFELNGHAITVSDTAGLRGFNSSIDETFNPDSADFLKQHNSIEREGIRRALEVAKEANLVIYLIDGIRLNGQNFEIDLESELKELDQILLMKATKPVLHLIINKLDLNDKLSEDRFECLKNRVDHLSLISCATGENFICFLEKLANDLDRMVLQMTSEGGEKERKLDYINERHLSLLRSTHRHLKRAGGLDLGTVDEMAQHIRESVDYLSRIVGSVTNEQVIDMIFRDFCIGK